MTLEDFDKTLVTFRNRTPFRPFTVVLADEDRFEVDSPDAYVVRKGVAIYAAPGGAPTIFGHEDVKLFIGDLTENA
jgi:hypothetical protein